MEQSDHVRHPHAAASAAVTGATKRAIANDSIGVPVAPVSINLITVKKRSCGVFAHGARTIHRFSRLPQQPVRKADRRPARAR
ncbi:hypothetical protein [Burkholderia pyrrocinia]|uniref:hypothetical protein n=1 Tax=Burkholderia pyrrocinia TaxID=60550 RepID=UPI00126A4C60|nr:hypothetical protein [Burkholderia pyrrocinia]